MSRHNANRSIQNDKEPRNNQVPEHRTSQPELVEILVDGYDIAMIVDALDVWQAEGCPANNPILDQNPPTKKQVEDLRWRFYGADRVVIHVHRVDYKGFRNDGTH